MKESTTAEFMIIGTSEIEKNLGNTISELVKL
jgi:hypothetical protein